MDTSGGEVRDHFNAVNRVEDQPEEKTEKNIAKFVVKEAEGRGTIFLEHKGGEKAADFVFLKGQKGQLLSETFDEEGDNPKMWKANGAVILKARIPEALENGGSLEVAGVKYVLQLEQAQQTAAGGSSAALAEEVNPELEGYKTHFDNQQNAFSKLVKAYKDGVELDHLPDLLVYPKLLPNPQEAFFLLRALPLELFDLFRSWDSPQLLEKQHGLYLAGPNGIGKSAVVYIVACLARASDWIVLYIPQCDEWVGASKSAETSMNYLLRNFAIALAKYLDEPVVPPILARKSWRSLLELGMVGDHITKTNVLEAIIKRLCTQRDRPFLLIFDEVNALFTMNLPNTSICAKNGAYFVELAATLNRLTINRGWKLISGTGHQRFLDELPSGLMSSVRYLIPFEPAEFQLMLKSNICHPWIVAILEKVSPSVKETMSAMLATLTGRVPRRLRDLSKSIDRTVGSTFDDVNFFFEDLKPPVKQPILILKHLLAEYYGELLQSFSWSHSNYFSKLPTEDKQPFNRVCLEAVTFSSTTIVPTKYLELDLIYWNPVTKRYQPLMPAAGQAIVENIRASSFDSLVVEDSMRITNAPNRDEAARPFERVFMKLLVYNSSCGIETTKLNGGDPETFNMNCRSWRLIPNPDSKHAIAGRLPRLGETSEGTLLVPEQPDYPVADFILLDRNTVFIFQLTLSHASAKLPIVVDTTKETAYAAIYSRSKWAQICDVSDGSVSSNFAECILNSVLGINNSKVELKGQALIVDNPIEWKIVYIIVSPQSPTMKQGEEMEKKLADSFPWVRVMTNRCLMQLVGDVLFHALQKD